jgi:sugar phosphate isomerase/epimerase
MVLSAKPAGWPSIGMCLFGARSLDEGLRTCSAIGYENVELYRGPSPTDPVKMSRSERRKLRRRLDSLGLKVSGLSLDASPLGGNEREHAENLEKIKMGAQLAHDLFPEAPPPLQAQSNGRSADWETDRTKLGDRLASWAETAAAAGITIGLKAHADNAVDTPEKLLWLMQRIRNRAVRVNYDYSHFEFTGPSLAGSLTELMPYVIFIQVKDARMADGHRRFLLPGEGDIDYPAYFRLLRRLGYAGPVVVEVSGQVVPRPNFNFNEAAEKCFAVLAGARRSAF